MKIFFCFGIWLRYSWAIVKSSSSAVCLPVACCGGYVSCKFVPIELHCIVNGNSREIYNIYRHHTILVSGLHRSSRWICSVCELSISSRVPGHLDHPARAPGVRLFSAASVGHGVARKRAVCPATTEPALCSRTLWVVVVVMGDPYLTRTSTKKNFCGCCVSRFRSL